MNNLISVPNETNMTSIEISELTKKRHDSVLRDIRNQLDQQQLGHHIFEDSYLSKQNKPLLCFNLDYHQTMILISGYSIPLRSKIISRWTELEKQNKPAIPQSYPEALKLAYEQALQIEQQQEQLQLQEPKVTFYNQVTESKDTIPMGQVAKVLNFKKIGRNKLFKILRELKILRYNNDPYQEFIDRGYFRIKEQKYDKPSGETGISFKTIVYQKGLVYIQKRVTRYLENNGVING